MSSKMTEYAESLGLTENELDETIHEIMAERASLINNQGLEEQIEFLYSDYCDAKPDVMRALLTQIQKEKRQ